MCFAADTVCLSLSPLSGALYRLIGADTLPTSLRTPEHVALLVSCLEALRRQKRSVPVMRAAGFIKRLAMLTLALPDVHSALAVMAVVHGLLHDQPRTHHLLTADSAMMGTAFRREIDDAEKAHSMSAALFELTLLRGAPHWHPTMGAMCDAIFTLATNDDEVDGVGASDIRGGERKWRGAAPPKAVQVARDFDFSLGVFHPPIAKPKKNPAAGRLRKHLRAIDELDALVAAGNAHDSAAVRTFVNRMRTAAPPPTAREAAHFAPFHFVPELADSAAQRAVVDETGATGGAALSQHFEQHNLEDRVREATATSATMEEILELHQMYTQRKAALK